MNAKLLLAVALLWTMGALATAHGQTVRELPSPAGKGSGQPNLAVDAAGRVYLSWLERLEGKRFALRFAVREGAKWSEPRTIAESDNWFVNWADFPSLAVLPDGSLAAHWLARSGPGVYAYDVNIARSFDKGKTWSAAVTPHNDGTQTEHGFVSMFPIGKELLGAVWLDGREMKEAEGGGHGHGQMTLRFATLKRDSKIESEAVLDGRVCECCQTSAALTSEGVVVVYRDRSEGEIRDISVVRRGKDGRWSEPRPVHEDGWKIDGCPVNGPSVAARGRRVAVGWFTMAGGSPHVRLAFSEDAGATFGKPVEVGGDDPVGRVDVLMLDDGSALVTWIEKTKGGAEVRTRRVRPDGRMEAPATVAPSGEARSSGFPQAARSGDTVTFAWTSSEGVKTAEMKLPRR